MQVTDPVPRRPPEAGKGDRACVRSRGARFSRLTRALPEAPTGSAPGPSTRREGQSDVDILMSENRRPAEATQSLGILSLVHARGRHGDIGFQVGRHRVDQVRRMVETYPRLLRHESEELGVADWAEGIRVAP